LGVPTKTLFELLPLMLAMALFLSYPSPVIATGALRFRFL
jgi:hypothetical protein